MGFCEARNHENTDESLRGRGGELIG